LTPLLYRLGHLCARHPIAVLGVWVLIAASVVFVAKTVGQDTNDDLSLPGTDSQAASDLLSDKFPKQANGTVPIALRAPKGHKLTDLKYKRPIQRIVKAYSKDPAVTQATGPFGEDGSDQINKKRTIAYISLNLEDGPSELNLEKAQRIIAVAQPLDKVGLQPRPRWWWGSRRPWSSCCSRSVLPSPWEFPYSRRSWDYR
jgi:RND superfamily putative drug exporter